MKKKDTITFCNYQVIIDDKNLDKNFLEPLLESGFKKNASETAIKQITAKTDTENDRFIFLIFSTGDVFPLPPNLINTENGEFIKNKRNNREIEPKYHYGFIDLSTGDAWLQHIVRGIFREALETSNPDKKIEIKQVLDEELFLKSLNELNEIKLGIKPDLLNYDTLSKSLQEDIYGFDASYAEVIFKYKETSLANRSKLLLKIKSLLGNKKQFKKLVITGRDTDKLDLIFNNDKITSKISVSVPVDENGIVIEEALFKQSILRVLDMKK